MRKLFEVIGALAVVAGAAAVAINYLYDVRFSLSINKKDRPEQDEEEDCFDEDGICDCRSEEPCDEDAPAEEAAEEVTEEAPAEEPAEPEKAE